MNNRDLLNPLRKRLTIIYSSLLIICLLVFIVLIYTLVSNMIDGERRDEVTLLAINEMGEHLKDLKNWQHEKEVVGYIRYEPYRSAFYYILTKNGDVVTASELYPELREEILSEMKERLMDEKEYYYLNIADRKLLLYKTSVYDSKNFLGYVYTGKDITSSKLMLKNLVWLLCGLSLIFSIILAFLGYYMAGQALIPIKKSFDKQRQFVADASHELRTPLAILYSSLEIFEEEEKSQFSSFSKKLLVEMKDEMKRMAHIIGDLLALARADVEKMTLNLEALSLNEQIEKVVRAYQMTLDHSKHRLLFFAEDELQITADVKKLTQMLHIFIDNAVKYTPKGDISIKLKKVQRGERTFAKIIIKDEGIGISKVDQPYIFDRFYRVDKARSRTNQGTGLGLSIAKSIIHLHNGTVQLKSKLGEGTTFMIKLPCEHHYR